MKFTDLKGREWEIKITHGTAMRLKEDGHNIYGLEDDKAAKLKQLLVDPFEMLVWIWRIVKPQATTHGVTEADFYDSLGGLAMMAAKTAFAESYADFTQNPAIRSSLKNQAELERRAEEETQRATNKMLELAKKHVAEMSGSLNDENIERMFSEMLSEATSKRGGPPSATSPKTPNEPSSV